MIGIVSYIPEGASFRRQLARRQMRWLSRVSAESSLIGDAELFVVAQGPHKRVLQAATRPVVADHYDRGIGQSSAINCVLRRFEASEGDWLLLLDNDIIGTRRWSLPALLSALLDEEWDVCSLVEHDYPVPDVLRFVSTYFICSAGLLLRKPAASLRFDEEMPYMKDVDFGVRAQLQGLSTYRIAPETDVLVNGGSDDSELFDSHEERWDIYNRLLNEKSEEYGVSLEPFGSFQSGEIVIDP